MEDWQNYLTAGTLPREEFLTKMKDLFEKSISFLPEWSGSFDRLLTDGLHDDQIWAIISVTNNELLSVVEEKFLEGNLKRREESVVQEDESEKSDEEDLLPHQVHESSEYELSEMEEPDLEVLDEFKSLTGEEEDDLRSEEDDLRSEEEENDLANLDEEYENVEEEYENVDEEYENVEEEYENVEEKETNISDIKYKDFFEGDPTEIDFDDMEDLDPLKVFEAKNPRQLDLESDEEQDPSNLSTFEKNQKRLKREISQLEMENASTEKPWTLRGEVTAAGRPLDSLLEVQVDFENNAKPVPVITQEYCDNLDQVIMQRIKDGMFDDVERRSPPIQSNPNKASVELDSEKSTKGLAQVYEEQYLNKDGGGKAQSGTGKAEHLEIKSLLSSLMNKLDALSNYHFTPKIPKQEIQIVSNVAAIAVEEAIPVAVSGASMVAPVEIYQGKTPMAYSEYSKSKKRRIAKSSARKKHARANEGSSDKQKAIQQLSKQRNVIVKGKSAASRSTK